MKTKLLFTRQSPLLICTLLVYGLCLNYGWSQNLMLNPTCDDHGTAPGSMGSTTDNADAYDLTPNNNIKDEVTGIDVPSPYQAIWDNDALGGWLEDFYNGGSGVDEQPGSTSSGAGGTRGVKLYMDTSPNLPGVCTRRIYQKVEGLTIGLDYTFAVDSRSEAMGTPSEVYLLNTEIADEVGINANGGADSSVDGFMTISDDFNSDSSVFTNNSVTFTASNTFVVVYIRSLNSVDGDTEVFYDNFSLTEEALSVNDFSSSSFKVYPNPANDIISIASNNSVIDSIEIFDILGKKVFSNNEATDKINVSNLRSGVYIMNINAEGRKFAKKLIIE